jgi:flagellum-specific peptidoglycan hydrolase FlgJ
MARGIVVVFTALFLVSCGSKKVVYSSSDKRTAKKIEKKSPKKSAKELAKLDSRTRMRVYVLQYAPLAQKEMKKFGIPASITLAQGLLES